MTDVYVERANDGTVKGVYANPQKGYAEEAVAADAAEVVNFRKAPPRRYVDPSAIVSRLQPFAAELKAAVEGDAQMWMFWQRMVGRNKPIDTSDQEFPIAWQLLSSVVGKDNADRILAEVMSEAV